MTGCAVLGVGLTPFGKHLDRSLKELAAPAAESAIADAGIEPDEVDIAFVASTVSAVTTGQVAVVGQVVLSHVGISGIPVYTVDNACAGGSAALNLATHALRAGVARMALVVGVEKLYAPDRGTTFRALNGAADMEWVRESGIDPERESVFVSAVYAQRLRDYAARAPLDAKTLARIAVKNRRHAAANPYAQYRDPLTIEDVLAARPVAPPVTSLMCSPIADGAAAAVISTQESERAVWIRASRVSMGSPPPRKRNTVERIAAAAYADAGIRASDLDVAEVHDATAFSELQAYEDLGLCQPGAGTSLVEREATSLGGSIPVNPSGGLESRGHPLAATGLAQVAELTMQLRGEAGERQVAGADVAVAETAGGFVNGDSAAVAVSILARGRDGDRRSVAKRRSAP